MTKENTYNEKQHIGVYPGVGRYCNAFGMIEASSSMVVSSLKKFLRRIRKRRIDEMSHASYSSVIVACLNGNSDAFGLPDAKLIVDGGERANN